MIDIQKLETYIIDDKSSLSNINDTPLKLMHISRKHFPINVW